MSRLSDEVASLELETLRLKKENDSLHRCNLLAEQKLSALGRGNAILRRRDGYERVVTLPFQHHGYDPFYTCCSPCNSPYYGHYEHDEVNPKDFSVQTITFRCTEKKDAAGRWIFGEVG